MPNRTTNRRLRLPATLLVLALLAAACGLKPEGEAAIGFAPRSDAGPDQVGLADAGQFPAEGLDGATGATGLGGSGASGGAATGGSPGSATTPATGTTPAAGGAASAGGSATSTTGGSRPAGTPAGGTPAGGTPAGGTPAGGTPAGGTPAGGTPAGGTPAGGTPAGAAPAGGEAAPPAGGASAITGSDRTGVDAAAGSINVAIHAPVTGAAPLPVNSFEEARDLYFRYALAQSGDIGGFTQFNISFADDRYQPSTAVQACRQLAASNFLLVGAGGTDQIQACGRFADQSGIPYFSAGVTEAGLSGLPNYFAFSMTYRQQGLLLAQYVAANFPGKKVAAIITDTENFADSVAGWEAGVQQSGIDYYRTLRHPKGDTSWYNTFANELAQNGVEVVYILSAPLDYIRFAQQASGQGFAPQYVGVGVSMALNAVLGSGCPSVDNGIFFSPFPGLDWARQNEPDFFAAAAEFGTPNDDIALALWAQGKILAELLESYEATYGSNDLTREDFRNLVETSSVSSGIFPDINYSAENHFGANQVHVLQADCASGEHQTLATFASGF